ncbi:hypothetical protein HMPREF1981_00254 [Bacteroides pyogenes F0041]|uniref:Uncharacterized protein n=1 Tax=Bacteroides pyogenes F0041 TaxID=1321819 RepID=U2CWA7_9BACE|nr:hypothetical protein HMPREF1981_00254 [Bacteroides pyogenes F0041]
MSLLSRPVMLRHCRATGIRYGKHQLWSACAATTNCGRGGGTPRPQLVLKKRKRACLW